MREATDHLLSELVKVQEACISKAAQLTNEHLDNEVTMGTRQVIARNVLYMLVGHPREHSVHINKILQATGAPSAAPTEAQMILARAKESMGDLLGTFARLDDSDLDREQEGYTLRGILEHLTRAHQNYLSAIGKVLP